MTTSIDTNVIVALWDRDPAVSAHAQKALDAALGRGSLVVSAPVFDELMAAPGRTEAFLDKLCSETGMRIEFDLKCGNQENEAGSVAPQSEELYSAEQQNDTPAVPKTTLVVRRKNKVGRATSLTEKRDDSGRR